MTHSQDIFCPLARSGNFGPPKLFVLVMNSRNETPNRLCFEGYEDQWTLIKKYGSTSYVGIDQVKNGRLYLRYGSSSEKTTAMCDETVTDKKPCLYYCKKKCPRSSVTPHKSWEKTNLKISILLVFFLLSSSCITQKDRTHMNVLHVKRILYYWRGAFSWLELHASHKRWVIMQNMHHSCFPRCHFGAYLLNKMFVHKSSWMFPDLWQGRQTGSGFQAMAWPLFGC